MKFVLNIQLFASKKGVGSTKNGRDSESKRLGSKIGDGQFCKAGSIIYRQRGTKIHPGLNCGRGGDDTLFAKVKILSISRPKNSFIASNNSTVINKATIMLLIVAFTDCTSLFFI